MAFNLTQAQATEIWRRLGQAITAHRRIDLARRYLTQGVYEVLEESDPSGFTSAWRLLHVERLKSTDGLRVYVSLVVAAGTATVSLYKDAAKTQQIATGAGAVGTTVSLAGVGVDGIGASVAVAAGATSTETIRLMVRPSALRIWSDQFRFESEDQEAANRARDYLRALDGRLVGEASSFFGAAVEEGLFRRFVAPVLELDAAAPLLEARRTSTAGEVQEQFAGLVPAFVSWAKKNAPAQSVTANSVSVGTPTIDGAGAGTLAATAEQNLPNGSLALVCVAGFPGASPEQFSVRLEAEADWGAIEQPRELLTKDRTYRLLQLGLRDLKLSGSVTQSGTGAFMFDASAWRLFNALGGNTLDGVLTAWVRVVAPTPPATQYATEIRWYAAAIPSASSTILDSFEPFRVALDTIFTPAAPTPGNLPTTSRVVSGTGGLSITHRLVDVPVDFVNGDILVVNANPFRVGTRITTPLVNNKAGRFATEFGRLFRFPLPASASPTADDNFIEPFPDFQD